MLSKLFKNFSNVDSKPVVIQEEKSSFVVADSNSTSSTEGSLSQDHYYPASKPIDIKYYVPTSDALGLSQSLVCHTDPLYYHEFGSEDEDVTASASNSEFDIYSKSVPVEFCSFSEYMEKARVVCSLDVEELIITPTADEVIASTCLTFGSISQDELFVKYDADSLVLLFQYDTEQQQQQQSSGKDDDDAAAFVFGSIIVDDLVVKRDVSFSSLIFGSTTDEDSSLIFGSTTEEDLDEEESVGSTEQACPLCEDDEDARAGKCCNEHLAEQKVVPAVVEHYAVENHHGTLHYFGPIVPVYISTLVPAALPCPSIPPTIPEVDEDFVEWTELADAAFNETSCTPWDAMHGCETSVERIKKNPFIPLMMKRYLSPLKITQLPKATQYKEIQNHFFNPNVVYIRHLKFFRCAYIVYRNRQEMIKAYQDPYLHFVENKPVCVEFSTMDELERDYDLDEQRRLACPISITVNKKYDTFIPNYHNC